ncbi:MAG: hypothetical protein ACOVQA_01925, partial [Thermoflexibacteraceae bacterium]
TIFSAKVVKVRHIREFFQLGCRNRQTFNITIEISQLILSAYAKNSEKNKHIFFLSNKLPTFARL